MSIRKTFGGIAALCVALVITGAATAPAGAAENDGTGDGDVVQLEFNGQTDFTDMGPVHMVIDAETNTITSVTPIEGVSYSSRQGEARFVAPSEESTADPIAARAPSVGTTCSGGNVACWRGVNLAVDRSFVGTGTATGNWPGRGSYYSGGYSGSVCYLSPATTCSGTVPAGSLISIAGPLTGVRVTLG